MEPDAFFTPAYLAAELLLLELALLMDEGGSETDEADELRERLHDAANSLATEERQALNCLSGDLYDWYAEIRDVTP